MQVCPDCVLELRDAAHCPQCFRPTVPVERARAVQNDGLLGLTLREKFFLRRVIRRSGLYTAYLADNKEAGGEAEVRVIRHDLVTTRTERRFYVSCASASKLDDRCFPRTLGFGRGEQGHLYWAIEPLRGETLAQKLTRSPFSPDGAVRLVAQLLDAVTDAHRERFAHGDIKPANVLLVGRTRAVLVDPGLASALEGDALLPVGDIDSLAYRAPEWEPGTAQPSTDIYSLGCLLHELLLGTPPFGAVQTGADWAESMRQQHRRERPELPATLPSPLAELLDGMLQKRPDRRMRAATLQSRLKQLVQRGVPRLRPTAAAASEVEVPRPAAPSHTEPNTGAPAAAAPAAVPPPRDDLTRESSSDTPAPPDDSRESSVDTRESPADTRESSVDTRESSADTRESSGDTRESSADTRGSSVDTRESSADTRGSSVDTRESSADTRESSVDTRESSADTRESSPAIGEPQVPNFTAVGEAPLSAAALRDDPPSSVGESAPGDWTAFDEVSGGADSTAPGAPSDEIVSPPVVARARASHAPVPRPIQDFDTPSEEPSADLRWKLIAGGAILYGLGVLTGALI